METRQERRGLPNSRLDPYGILAGKFFDEPSFVMVEKDNSLLHSRQATELLDLSPDTVNELASKNTLPAVKRG